MPSQTPRAGGGRWLVLCGAVVIQLILGTVYGYSIFWNPLEARLFPPVVTEAQHATLVAAGENASGHTVVADEAAATALHTEQEGRLKYAFAICVLSFSAVMVFAGRVQDITGPRIPAVIGAALIGASFLAAGFLTRPGSTWSVYLLWGTIGFLAGAGIGFAYVCPIAALIKWFPQHKGLVSGLAVAGFGFGAFIFKGREWYGALGYINTHGVLEFFRVHGLVCLIAILGGALLLRNPPGAPAKSSAESNWRETLRRPAFWVLWLMYFSGSLAGLMVIGIVAVFAGEQLVAAARAANVGELSAAELRALMGKGAAAVGWLAIFNAVGRVFWGFFSDRLGRTTAFVVNFVFQSVVMFGLARLNTELSITIAACLVGFNYGGCFALFPSATADFFGARNLGANYGWLFTSYGIAGFAGIYAGNWAKAQTGSYEAAFMLAGALCVVSALLAIFLAWSQRRPRPATVLSGRLAPA